MKPYFETHPIGVLYLIAVATWYGAEMIQFFRQRQWRKEARKAGPRRFWAAFVGYVIVAITMLIAAPHLVPEAAIGHGAAAFAVGLAMVVAGAGLRLWSFQVLGEYFTFTVKVSSDQPVVTAGPYRVLRHPGYAGGVLATIGIGVLYGNWVSLATMAIPCLAIVVWRIRIEETALLATTDDRYHEYASHHKRLIPLVW